LQLPSPDHDVDEILSGLVISRHDREEIEAHPDHETAEPLYAELPATAPPGLTPEVGAILKAAAMRLSTGIKADDKDIAAQ
jgi:hypothetical protein